MPSVTTLYPTVNGGATTSISPTSAAAQAAIDAQEDRDAVEAIRDDMASTTSLAYREFTDQTAAPANPSGDNLRLYFLHNEAYVAAATGTKGAPYKIPSYATGAITVSPTDDWLDIITNHAGGSVVTFTDGTYDFGGTSWSPENTNSLLYAQNIGGAIFENFRLVTHGKRVVLSGFDITPPDDGSYLFFVQGGSDISFYDCCVDISAFANTIDTLGLTKNSFLEIRASTRDSEWTMGDRITTQILDIDSTSAPKFVGNLTTKRVKFTHSSNISGIIVDASCGILTGTELYKTGGQAGNAIVLRRSSGLYLANNCVIDGYANGFRASSGSSGVTESTTFNNNAKALYRDEGGRIYKKDNNVFTSNTADEYDAPSSGTLSFPGPVTISERLGIGTFSPETALEIEANAVETAVFTASITNRAGGTGRTLDVTAVTSGTIAAGDRVYGFTIDGVEFNTIILPFGTTVDSAATTGTGGIGTYAVTNAQNVSSSSMRSVSGGTNVIRITNLDTASEIASIIGALEFYGSDASTATAGIKAYIAAVAQSASSDAALLFGVADNVSTQQAKEVARFDRDGNFGIGTKIPTRLLDVNDNGIRIRSSKTPSSASDTGNAGDICWDSSYIYVCTATNTWKRVAIATW